MALSFLLNRPRGFIVHHMLVKEKKDYRAGHRQRLRQRFLAGGKTALADYELLELLLFAAHPRGDVKPLAKTLLSYYGSLGKVFMATPDSLSQVEGVGEAAIAAIKMAEAAAQAMLEYRIQDRPVLSNWTSLLDYCHSMLAGKTKEEFHILFLNTKNHLIAAEKQQTGTINNVMVYPREVIARALELGAGALILVHNHPTGDTKPSQADIDMTRRIIQAGLGVSIQVHDHLIIGANGHYSFKSEGMI